MFQKSFADVLAVLDVCMFGMFRTFFPGYTIINNVPRFFGLVLCGNPQYKKMGHTKPDCKFEEHF